MHAMPLGRSIQLSLDTSDRMKAVIAVRGGGWVKKQEVETPSGSGSAVLEAIGKLLEETGHSVKDIAGIEVATGPGSYTGLRVGAAIANTLGALLGIPVNGLPVGEIVTPLYGDDRW